jgi:CBS domain-containing protein
MRARVPVFEIMSQNPITIAPSASAAEAARIMREKEIGSLIVTEGGKPAGIVTERDLVTKVAARDLRPGEVHVKDLMTSPVVAIHPDAEVVEAAKLMSSRKIRRLAVIKDGALVGVITENDILRVWPSMVEVTREWDRAGLDAELKRGIEGHCESCGVYSTNLVWDGNLLACPECRAG